MHIKNIQFPFGVSDNDINLASHEELLIICKVLLQEFVESIRYAIPNKYETELGRLKKYSELLFSSYSVEDVITEVIFTGAILEGVLQFFLLVFHEDYEKTHWHQWKSEYGATIDFKQVRSNLFDAVNKLKNNNSINTAQAKSLKKAIKSELSKRENGVDIPFIMLNDLIELFSTEKIFSTSLVDNDEVPSEELIQSMKRIFGDEYEIKEENEISIDEGTELIKRMTQIRDARNNIHIFSSNTIPSQNDVIENVRLLCLIVNDLTFRIDCKSGFLN